MHTVLLVEDDQALASAAVRALQFEQFDVVHAETLVAARSLVAGCSVVLLDLGLPDAEGYQACAEMVASGVPVVVATARDAEIDRVVCLELGADDYVIKPYLMREVAARLRAVLRRAGATRPSVPTPTPEQVLQVDGIEVDRRTRTASCAGAAVALTAKEFDLLAMLLEDPDAVHHRDKLLYGVWGDDFVGSGRTLDTHVASLRKKLGEPDRVVSVRGVGYRLRRTGG